MMANQQQYFKRRRQRMIEDQLVRRGIHEAAILRAMETVPREKFVNDGFEQFAYDDRPLPIGSGQTISQPYIVAFMIEALQLDRGDSVLEIGAGSGYAAAVLSELTARVYAIERIADLAEVAQTNLRDAGYGAVQLRCDDGTLGWPEAAPFDAILVSAGAPEVPETLKRQLKIGGRMVVPVGNRKSEQILLYLRRLSKFEYEEVDLGDVRFVPLIGAEGWRARVGPSMNDPMYACP